MKCAWQELIRILPTWLGVEADNHRESLQEIRLRLGQPTELITWKGNMWLPRMAEENDLKYCMNTASRYSPWAAQSIAKGYLTAYGGHRIGICGDAVIKHGEMTGIRKVESINIRIARDFPGIAASAKNMQGSILIIGPPGSGKTTMLRDLARLISERETVSVVDERGELFPEGFQRGRRMDVLTGCSKSEGIDTVLRTMGPECIAVDEITSEKDCAALLRSGWCGVRLAATAHAFSLSNLKTRPIYIPLLKTKLFSNVLIMNRDKSWKLERMDT